MFLKRLAIILGIALVAAGTLLVFLGPGKGEPDRRLAEIADRQEKQEQQFGRMAQGTAGIEHKLDQIRALLRAERGKRGETEVVEFKETPEYKELAGTMSDLQQKLKLAKSNLAEAEKERERQRLRSSRDGVTALVNPQKMIKRLDVLAEDFGQKIEDPARRNEFKADVARLKWVNSDEVPAEELINCAISDLKRRINDQRYSEERRNLFERGVQRLESTPDLDLAREQKELRMGQNILLLGDLIEKYSMALEDVYDAGLPWAWRGSFMERGLRVY